MPRPDPGPHAPPGPPLSMPGDRTGRNSWAATVQVKARTVNLWASMKRLVGPVPAA